MKSCLSLCRDQKHVAFRVREAVSVETWKPQAIFTNYGG